MEILKCSSTTIVQKLASCIYSKVYSEQKEVALRVVGAGALSQAVKAVIVANGLLSPKGMRVLINPNFSDLDGITAIDMPLKVEKI